MVRPKQDRAVRTKETVLRAAAEVFDEQGFGASIVKIAERAGTTTGAIYFHFQSKEGLLQAVINAQPETIRPRLESSGVQQLVDITLTWCWQIQVDPLLRAGVRLAVEQGAFGLQDDTSFRDWQRIMEECLLRARDAGELLEHAVPEEIAEIVVSTCTGGQIHSHLASGRADLPQRVVRMWRYLLPSIAKPEVVERIDLDPQRGQAS
ncbi:ScbR family autoregulator-binding transcription factor [Streptomyces sp. NPDC001661]